MTPKNSEQLDALGYSPELSVRLIAEVRKKLNLNQTQFGELVGMHYVTVSKMESGKAPIEQHLLDKLLILIEVLKVPGAADILRYVTLERNGMDGFYLAQTIDRILS